jgi:large subunit ribosomal protein L3
MTLGLLAKKAGMTTLIDEQGDNIPVTIVVVGPCDVIDTRTTKSHGYEAVQLAFDDSKKERGFTKAVLGHFKSKGAAPKRYLEEFRCADGSKYARGVTLTVRLFKKGETVDVRGRTKGRGFQGVIKRWGKHGGPATHGSHFHRSTGSIGQRTWPGRVFKNMKMPGQMGNVFRTIRGLEVVEIDPELNLLYLRGAIPGPKNGLLRIMSQSADFEERCMTALAPQEAKEATS